MHLISGPPPKMRSPSKVRSVLTLFGIVLVLVAGCSANYSSIYRLKKLDDQKSAVLTIDAKQRAILISKDNRPSAVAKFCSEPSPDVFSVIAQAFTASGSFSKSADPASLQAALSAAFSSSEQGSTIPRTQTVNMLRELMFRTCERYLNGGYTGSELPIQAVRDQRLMVSILAIEQLTGAIAPKPVVLGATAGTTPGNSSEAIVRLDDARKDRDAAQQDLVKAQEAFDNQNGDSKVCDAITAALAAGTELTDDQKTAQPGCADATSKLATAKKQSADKQQQYSDLQRLSTGLGASTSASVATPTEGAELKENTESVNAVAAAVQAIVAANFNDGTEVMLFCLRTLGEAPQWVKNDQIDDIQKRQLSGLCVDYLKENTAAAVAQKAADKARLESEIAQSQAAMIRTTDALFDSYWPHLELILKDPKQKAAFVESLRKRVIPSDAPAITNCFSAATTKDAAHACFSDLPSDVKRTLAGGK